MRGQHTCRASRRCFPRTPHLVQDATERLRPARHGRGTERRDAIPRQPFRDRANGIALRTHVQRIDAVDAVHMDVDETGHDVMAVKREV